MTAISKGLCISDWKWFQNLQQVCWTPLVRKPCARVFKGDLVLGHFFLKLGEISDNSNKIKGYWHLVAEKPSWHGIATLFSLVRGRVKYSWLLRSGSVVSGNCILEYSPNELFLFIKPGNHGALKETHHGALPPNPSLSGRHHWAVILVASLCLFGQNQRLMSRSCPSTLFTKSELRSDQTKRRTHLFYLFIFKYNWTLKRKSDHWITVIRLMINEIL